MSVPRSPLDGHPDDIKMLQAAMSEASLIIHSPPDIPPNAEILGVCGVSAENADQHKYGWMVADFLHWKTLFYRVGNKEAQTWISSLDLLDYLDGIRGIDMDDGAPIRKIAGEHNGQVTKIPGEADGYMAAFVGQIAQSARAAVARKTTLFIMVFAPVTPEHDICIDFSGEMKTYMTAEHLHETIHDAVGNVPLPVILVTPSAFTGGWLCRPWFMNRPACSSSDTMMRVIAKSCGGAFSERFVHAFTHRDTPLLTDIQRAKFMYDDPMPIGPTTLQTDLLHRFQRQIHESLEKRLSALALQHAFIIPRDDTEDSSSAVDSWTSFAPRQGRSMRFWAKQWPPSRPRIENADPFEFLGEAFGGSQQSQLFHLKYLAEIELDTCPGDWNKNGNGTTRLLLLNALRELVPNEDNMKRVFDAIEFRASSMVLAHTIAKAFNLPMPDNAKCRYWVDTTDGVDEEYYRKLQTAFGEVRGLFGQVPVLPGEKRHDYNFARFWRAARWLSAAIALKFAGHSRQDVERFVVKNVARLFTKIQDTQKALLMEDRIVTSAGRKWLAALGLADEKDEEAAASSAARSSILLDAQLRGLKAQEIDLISDDYPWGFKAGTVEAKPTTNDDLLDDTGGSLTGGKQHIVQDLLDDFDHNFGQGEKQVQTAFQDEAEDLLDLEDEKANEPAMASVSAVAQQPTSRDETERLVNELLRGTLPGFENVDPVELATQLLSKTAERKAQDKTGYVGVEDTQNKTSGVETTPSSVRGVGQAAPAERPASSLNVTANHPCMEALKAKIQPMTMDAPTPPQTPAPPRLAEDLGFGKSAEARDKTSVRVAASQRPAGSDVAAAAAGSAARGPLVEGDDCWARLRVKW
ncbi:hypothetical protein BT67DRAFT_454718 [Trichocladium antarcticum]|uniref:Uncharacterized protein n=1 Tax=Trichocladium antarcticum TaxID=1450529 RepID=A0AAN6UPY7_9PEZI|nr:hypothetical protein BT67DRAFT_454718 [Trichocladium antarcticum]